MAVQEVVKTKLLQMTDYISLVRGVPRAMLTILGVDHAKHERSVVVRTLQLLQSRSQLTLTSPKRYHHSSP